MKFKIDFLGLRESQLSLLDGRTKSERYNRRFTGHQDPIPEMCGIWVARALGRGNNSMDRNKQ